MTTIKIDWLIDEHWCETCGGTYADGAIVWMDDGLFLELRPRAHCYDSTHYDVADVYRLILEKLGYEVKEPKL